MEKIADRIKELIDNLQLTNSEFAKQVNLNPAIISHILGGRNKPSLQVIESIKQAFTNVNIDYLITGSGQLFNDFTNVNSPAMTDFSDSSGFPMEGIRVAAVPGETFQRNSPSPDPEPDNTTLKEKAAVKTYQEETPSESTEDRAIEQIVIFYKDGSFKAYRP